MHNLYDYTLKQLQELLAQYGEKPYRATQLFSWLYEKKATSFQEMSDISKKFRQTLEEEFSMALPTITVLEQSKDGTKKFLLELADGALVETALMPYNYGDAVCVSSQVGCNMGCSFCASGLLKKQRNLTAGEMVGQVLAVNKILAAELRHVTHVVVMGTGEPFDNYDNVLSFIRIINDPKSLAIGARHITVSTCGIVDGIYRYAKEGLQTNLAISLHAPNDEIRQKIMRIAKAYPLNQLIDAVRYYEENTNRRVTFEYILLKNINDSIACAEELARLIKGMLSHVNLIPYNPVKELPYQRSDEKTIHAFFECLLKSGIRVTIRKEFGKDIDASCGQLRAKHHEKDD